MGIHEFARKVGTALQAELGSGYQVEYREVRKNNGVLLCGLLVTAQGRNMVPTIYINDFWEAYEAGMTLWEAVRRILHIYLEETPRQDVDMDFFKSFEQVKGRICYRLVGRDGNMELLRHMPYVEYLDMAICFFYAFQSEVLGEGSIQVLHAHMEFWETDREELLGLARMNTPRLFPWMCAPLGDILLGALGTDCGFMVPQEYEGQEDGLQLPMKVLSNRQQLNGAACMLYPGVLDQIAAQMGCGFYILPSSVHEVILLPDRGEEDPGSLKSMVVQVNRTQVPREDILTDSLYCFDPAQKAMKKIL